MVLVDVKMLSGFTPVMSSIEEVSKRSPVFQSPESTSVLMKQLVSKAKLCNSSLKQTFTVHTHIFAKTVVEWILDL